MATLSDRELLEALRAAEAKSCEQTAEVLRVLGEVDARKAWATKAYGSLFAYCVGELLWVEGEAYHKIAAARAGRKYPALLERLALGQLHVSGIVVLAPKLTTANHEELIDAACGLSKRKLEAMLAERFPRPDVPESIRKTPVRAPKAAGPTPPVPAPTPSTPVAPGHASSLQLSAPVPAPKVEPLSAQRHKLTVTISGDIRERIERVQALLSHRSPEQQKLESVLDRALELLEAKLLKERFGVGAKPRKAREPKAERPATVPGDSSGGDRPEPATPPNVDDGPPMAAPDAPPPGGWPRTFGRADRRRIVARDGLRCAYVDPDTGERCTETRRLTLEHIEPWARGGPTTADNGQLLCASHNHLRARQAYGEDFIKARVATRRAGL